MTKPLGSGPVSALWPIDLALAAAIQADGPTMALLAGQGVYSIRAPAGAVMDYVVIGDSEEADTFRALMRQGSNAVLTLDVWSGMTESRAGVLAIYNALRKLLHTTALPVDPSSGVTFCRGSLELVTVLADRDSAATHGILRYTVLSRTT